VKDDITYHVLVANNYNCTATDSINIKTFCEGSQVFIPNAFTPDGDGRNDILMVRAKGIESVKLFRIFTRWGELIFEKTNFAPNDPAYGWDGKIKGVKGAPEVYVYTAEVVCTNMQTYMFKGNTSILK
jgi:gliding motility-associated-like protein